MSVTDDAWVIGAGPAGLMAAEVMAAQGLRVTVAEAMPSAGRKLLMAGKSGLNLTKQEPPDAFAAAFGPEADRLRAILDGFGPDAVQSWAGGLGQDLFTGSTGRVFPQVMKASPLLRAWLRRLEAGGVTLHRQWRWTGWDPEGALTFTTPEGAHAHKPRVTVLAMGGASWARLGSDGAWAPLLAQAGVALAPFAPANAGLQIAWSDHMARHFGSPVKAVALCTQGRVHRGEFVISARGLEGGGIYAISRAVREGESVTIDLLPDWPQDRVAARLASGPGKASVGTWLRKALTLDPARLALLMEFARPLPKGPALARLIKAVPLRHDGLRPLDEAISTAGGVRFDALDAGLMLRDRPGVFVAGEMLDWEAPTGGYLLTACLATGHHAGLAAARYAGLGE